MSALEHIDPEILNDFLTESSELIEGIDHDLVELERQSDNLELLNSIFRGLHTIKGSASFLTLDHLTHFAHAAEDALNTLRKGQTTVNAGIMDALLSAVDVVRGQLDELRQGRAPSAGPEELVTKLQAIGAGKVLSAATPTLAATAPRASTIVGGVPALKLALEQSKMDILPFMAEDLGSTVGQLRELLTNLDPTQNISQTAVRMTELTEELMRSVRFFEIACLCGEVNALHEFATRLSDLGSEELSQALPRIEALLDVLVRRAKALDQADLIEIPTQTLLVRLDDILAGRSLDKAYILPPGANGEQALRIDGAAIESGAAVSTTVSASTPPTDDSPSAPEAEHAETDKTESDKPAAVAGKSAPVGEQTIRVEVERLETLLNLVGELVLQKNRVLGMARRVHDMQLKHELTEEFAQIASDLEHITGELQMGVMKTRMQPLSKLFSRYPRVIRDLARSTGKQIDLQVEGGETEVDKTVLEGLGDPLVHILRNSADHGIELPQKREQSGKKPMGVIRLSARHEGNHVVVEIRDDGRGIDAEAVSRKAVERGMFTADEVAAMSRRDVLMLIFAAGLSTADKVSDLSGRGVGMDVVRTNVTRLNGMVNVESEPGKGSIVSIKIPLTVAIMPAMMVGVREQLYAVPLASIIEIVRYDPSQTSLVNQQQVLRLRDQVLPVVNLASRLLSREDGTDRFAVVVGLAEQRVALLVDRLLGQQEVVIKPLDDMFKSARSVSGATVRDDGGVSLIMDVAGLISSMIAHRKAAA